MYVFAIGENYRGLDPKDQFRLSDHLIRCGPGVEQQISSAAGREHGGAAKVADGSWTLLRFYIIVEFVLH